MKGIILIALLPLALTKAILDNVEVTFQLGGSINYVPSSGGVAIPGYSLTVGYDKHSWIGTIFLSQAFNFKPQLQQITTTP